MGDDLLERHGIDPHPLQGRSTWFIVGGGVLVSAGVVFTVLQELGSGLPAMGMGALLLFLGRQLRGVSAVVPAVNTAVQEARAGRVDNATELLDYVDGKSTNPYILRAVAQQRAQLACRRGDLEEVVTETTRLLELQTSWRHGIHAELQTTHAQALRAFALASLDRHEDAARDIEAVRRQETSTADALAQAELAQAVLLERRGERDALREHLRAEGDLLHEHTQPREREVVRALERMLNAKTQSVYRKAAQPPADDDPSVEDWVATIAPDAAGYAHSHGDAALPADPLPADDAAKKAASSDVEALTKGQGRKGAARLALLWLALIGVFLLIWTVLEPDRGGRPAATAETTSSLGTFAVWGLPTVMLVVLVGVFVAIFAKARALPRRLLKAMTNLARGDREAALAELDELTRCRQALTAASARDALANWAARSGRIDEALEHVDEALGKIATAQLRALASDQLLPSLLALRAWCLAALDRNDEAETTLTTLRTSFRAYYDLDAALLRVRAIQAARAGDVARLAELSNARAELGLSPRDELLLDLGRATVAPGSAGAGEIARLRSLLRSDGDLIRWAKALAPAVVAAFEKAIRPEAGAAPA